MLFRSKPFWILVSIFLYSPTVRAQLSLRSPEPRNHHEVQLLHVLLLQGSVRVPAGEFWTVAASRGLQHLQTEQEVSQQMLTVTYEAASVLKALKGQKVNPAMRESASV